MTQPIVRTDKLKLQPSQEVRFHLEATVLQYRAFCKALSYVVMGHWAELGSVPSFCAAVEKLIHRTSKNPNPKYGFYFEKGFYKFPSYLRRAAIEFVKGQVSSCLTRYQQWQAGNRNRRNAKPPSFNLDAGCYPALYKGQLVKFDADYSSASIKVWNGMEWVWVEVPIIQKRHRHLMGRVKSPYLVVSGQHCHLANCELCPEAWSQHDCL